MRDAIHFHALIRLDAKTDAGFAPAPNHCSASMLAELIATTVSQVRYEPPAAYATDPGRVLSFGAQIDARAVRATRRPDSPDEELSAEQVAGYLAKYATKSAADTVDTRVDTPHIARLRQVCREFASFAQSSAVWARSGNPQGRAQSQYELMGKWAHMLGFRGHFSTVIGDGEGRSPTPSSNAVTSPWEVPQSGHVAPNHELRLTLVETP